MANSDKNLVITPATGSSTDDPKIVFSGANASLGAQNITVRVYPDNNGTLSFEGSAGQLFSITNSLTGTIFSVNDVSGIPSIEVDDTGAITLARFNGNILAGSGTSISTDKVQVTGNLAVTTAGSLKLFNTANTFFTALKANSTAAANLTYTLPSTDGSNGQVLSTNGSGVMSWTSNVGYTGSVGTTGFTGSVGFTGSAGGVSKPYTVFRPFDNEPPATNFASFDVRNGHPVLNFDTTTQEAAIFSGVLPTSYAGGGLTVEVWWAAATATSGTIGWDVSIERIDANSLDIDADSFASAQAITAATVPATSGQVVVTSVAISNGANIDNLAAGEAYRVRLRRDVANDTATGDAQMLRLVVRET